jgi:hypothetical protein
MSWRLGRAGHRWEQRRTTGGNAWNSAFPNAAMFSQTIDYCPRPCNADLAPPQFRKEAFGTHVYLSEQRGEFGITPRRLRSINVSIRASSRGVAKSVFRVFPPVVLPFPSPTSRYRPSIVNGRPSTCLSSGPGQRRWAHRSSGRHRPCRSRSSAPQSAQ